VTRKARSGRVQVEGVCLGCGARAYEAYAVNLSRCRRCYNAKVNAARRARVEQYRLANPKPPKPDLSAKARWARKIIGPLRRRCRAAGWPVEVGVKLLEEVAPDRCPVLGIELCYTNSRVSDDSPSVDRVDQSKGYTPDNIRVVSWRVNRLKGDASADELEKIAAWMRQHEASIRESEGEETATTRQAEVAAHVP